MDVLYTLLLFVSRHRLLERGIHTFPRLFVNAGFEVYTLSLDGTGSYNNAYTLSLVCLSAQAPRYTHFRLSAQAFRTRRAHFPCVPVNL